jgi:hypothetical protein
MQPPIGIMPMVTDFDRHRTVVIASRRCGAATQGRKCRLWIAVSLRASQ